jgi:2',3'-cyclic-nucleotide 2'-phosphodiesterase (5'-nucleotidase family)
MKELVARTNSVWLMANLFFEGQIIGDLAKNCIIEHSGLKVGVFGLCEKEWLELLNPATITEDLHYKDFVQTAKEMSKQLRQ